MSRSKRQAAPVPNGAMEKSHWIGDAATVLLAVVVILRCLVMFHSSSPWTEAPVETDATMRFGPIGTAVSNWLIIVVLLGAFADRVRRGISMVWPLVGLWLIGSGVAAWYMSRNASSFYHGGTWIAATAGGLAALHLGDVERRKRLLAALFLGLILPLALEGVYQVAYQHDRDVAYYLQQKGQASSDAVAAKDDIAVRRYEARLFQNEATGPFALANVYGSVVTGLTIIGAGLWWGMKRRGVSSMRLVGAGVAVVLGIIAMVLTFSKGVLVVGAFGAGVMVVGGILGQPRKWVAWKWITLALAVVSIALIVIVARGLAGAPETEKGERSLFYRWMYLQASARMVVDHPMLGVGPGQFRESYHFDKNPLSAEDITDPHNVFSAFISMLGIGGWAWSILIIAMLCRAAKVMARMARSDANADSAFSGAATPGWYWLMTTVIMAGAFGIQYVVRLPGMTWENGLLFDMGVVGMILIAVFTARTSIPLPRVELALFAAAVAITLHSQVDMGMTHDMSSPLLWGIVGLAASSSSAACGHREMNRALIVVFAVIVVLAGWFYVPTMITRQRMAVDAVQSVVSGELVPGFTWPADGSGDAWVHSMAAQFELKQAIAADAGGHPAARDEHLAHAMDQLARARARNTHLSQLWFDQLRLTSMAWKMVGSPRWADAVIEAARQVVHYSPYGLTDHIAAADAAWSVGRLDEARLWYARALELDKMSYLEPFARLDEQERGRIESRLDP